MPLGDFAWWELRFASTWPSTDGPTDLTHDKCLDISGWWGKGELPHSTIFDQCLMAVAAVNLLHRGETHGPPPKRPSHSLSALDFLGLALPEPVEPPREDGPGVNGTMEDICRDVASPMMERLVKPWRFCRGLCRRTISPDAPFVVRLVLFYQ